MRYFIGTDETGRILSSTSIKEYAGGMVEFDLPDDFDFLRQEEYRVDGGELVHDPLPPTDAEQEAQRQAKRREQMEAATLIFVRTASLTDEQALTVSELFEEWQDILDSGRKCKEDTVIRHDGELYRVAKTHTPQSQWEPGAVGTESLYTHITKGGDGVDVWQRPTGAHDAYNTGDRVHYPDEDGPIYVSKIDGNTWSPEEYPQGWELE